MILLQVTIISHFDEAKNISLEVCSFSVPSNLSFSFAVKLTFTGHLDRISAQF